MSHEHHDKIGQNKKRDERMPTKEAVDSLKHEPVRIYPCGNPDRLLKRIAEIAKEWAGDRTSTESAMAGIEMILRQNKRV